MQRFHARNRCLAVAIHTGMLDARCEDIGHRTMRLLCSNMRVLMPHRGVKLKKWFKC